MQRSCNVCKKNNTQKEFGCPYIDKNPTKFYDFPLYGDPDFGIHGCPIYYKNEYPEILEIYDTIDDGLIDKSKLRYTWRFIYKVIRRYLDLKELKDREKLKKELEAKNGRNKG